ncbi:TPA: hypothetical protein VJE30_001350 [Streptococcus pyogenes]|nr:hypothetical protein [Streptococcus pyogenes]
MKFKKLISLVTLGLALFILVACGQKSAEDMAKNVLKDSYTGYSQESAYEGLTFRHGGYTLKFDKQKNIITNSDGKTSKFYVLPDEKVKKLPALYKGALTGLENELKGTDNFTITIGDYERYPDDAGAYYQIVLTDGGKKIRIIELRRGYKEDDAFYDFVGTAD